MVFLSLLFVGCNDDDNDDDANLPEVGKAFAATTEHWYMDLDGFEGAFKTAYDEMKAVLKTKDAIPGQIGYVMQNMYLTKERRIGLEQQVLLLQRKQRAFTKS